MNKKLIIMLLAMFVARTTDLFSQSMNKRTEETPQSVIANVHKAAQLLKEKGSEAIRSPNSMTGMRISSLSTWIKAS